MILDQLFIYGTLIPGDVRWGHLEAFVTSVEPDSARGLLYDTRLGFPAARFDATRTIENRILGMRVTLDRDVLDDCLEMLDELESAVTGLYRRLVIETDSGQHAWSYQYGWGIDDMIAIRSGSWVQHTTGTAPETGDTTDPESGDGLLSFFEARVIGALIEKALATPHHYPLSLSALVAACNQRSSRDPVTTLSDAEVMDVLTVGKERKLIRLVHPRSGHGVTKYRQVLHEFLEIDDARLALLGVLLLRGPQTARELRDRTERLHSFGDIAAVTEVLRQLADEGHVIRLERRPGQRDERWAQLLCGAVS